MALSVSRSTAEVAETEYVYLQNNTPFNQKINQYLHQGLIFSTCAATPLQSRVTDAVRQTVKTLLHVYEYPTSPEAIQHNFSNVPRFIKHIKSGYDMIETEVK